MVFSPRKVDVLTLFPGMFAGYLEESIVKRAQEKRAVRLRIVNLRDYTHDQHRTVDDKPFGGGAGMVLKPEPIFEAIEDLRSPECVVVLLSPRGKLFNQNYAQKLSRVHHLLFICGHYEGIDERVRVDLVDEEISIGDYVLTNGALPALVIIDSIIRLLPGVLGDPASAEEESFSFGLLEYPQYTRPAVFRGRKVPDVLRSGNHEEVARWRRRRALETTLRQRPDLIRKAKLSKEEREWMHKLMLENK